MPKRGGKRVKKRTHVAEVDDSPDNTGAAVPRSLVIKQPKTALPHTLAILQQELRKIMSPNTAQKLQERKYNTLKDYTHFAGLMKVTHLLLLAPGGKRQLKAPAPDPSTEAAVTAGAGALFKIARLPTGPTLTMRIEKYSLCRQVRALQKRPCDVAELYETAPLVVLNNFGAADAANPDSATASVPAHIKLMRITFQNMFPALDVATVRLSECRRVVLFNYDKEKDVVEQRHYAIRASNSSVSRPIKRVIMTKELPDLGHLGDISDWLLEQSNQAGDASDSEAEDGDRVVLPQAMRGRGNHASATAAVKLTELGPRLTMKLFKVERGVCEGDVMYHALESRTPEQVASQRASKAQAEDIKRKRREEQEGNVARKAAAEEEKRAAKRARREARMAAAAEEEEEEGDGEDGEEEGGSEGEEEEIEGSDEE